MGHFPIINMMLLLGDKAVYPSLNASLASRRRRRRRKRSRASRARASSSNATTTTSSSPETPFLCPLCGSKTVTLNCTKNTNTNLTKSLSCARNGHARDYAKEGYVHLMTTGNSIVGDAKEMVRSRKIFLDSGRFDFLFEEKVRGEVLRAIRRAGIFASSSSEEEDKDDEKRADVVEEEEKEVNSSSSGNNANGGGGGGSPRRKKLEAKKRLRALEKKEKKSKEARTVVFTIADVGCGDGYWLERISRWLVFGDDGDDDDDDEEVAWLRERAKERNVRFRFIGMDASKEAVRVAAKRMIVKNTRENKKLLDAEYFFAVADANDVPMGDDSIDIYLSVFAPRNGNEIARTLKEKGTLLIVSPSPSHLRELRSDEAKEKGVVCLDIEANKSERVEKQLKESASLFPTTKEKEAAAVTRAAPMDWRDVQLVLKMGASGFHQTAESLDAARSYWEERSDEDKKLTLSFRVCAFSRLRD